MVALSGTAFPLGAYVGNPNGNDAAAEQEFEAQFNSFVQTMGGARPIFMNAYVDLSVDPSGWGANAGWTAWSWAQSGNNYVAPGSGVTPVIGVPMSTNNWDGNVDQFYQEIVSGQYDDDYKAVVDAWAQQGFRTIDLRLGYEFNGTFMPWSPFNSSSPDAESDFVTAWQHLADVVHAAGQADGITVNTVWNPNMTAWSQAPIPSLYPGDQYVDIISLDEYSPTWTPDLTDWASGATTMDSSAEQWAGEAANRIHYWQYPDANFWNPTGTGAGWSLQNTIDFAKAHGKPISLSETGAGGDGAGLGPVDEPAFPQWLAGELAQAEAEGVPIAYVNIWDTTMSDGDWRFSGPGSNKPQEAAAWGQYFGAGSAGSEGGGGSISVPSSPTPQPEDQSAGGGATNPSTSPATQAIDQSATAASEQVFVPDASAWAAASPAHPIATKIGASVYQIIAAGSDGNTGGMLTASAAVAVADNQWGETAAIVVPSSSGSSAAASPASSRPTPPAVQTIDQSATAATDQVFVPDASAWAAASPTHPIATQIGRHVYNVIGASSDGNTGGVLITATAVVVVDNRWGKIVRIDSGAPKITVSQPSGSYVVNSSGTYGDDGFVLTDGNAFAVVHAGSKSETMTFQGLTSIEMTTGSGSDYVAADQGDNTFTIGAGGATVRGGAGSDSYVFNQNSGSLQIEDFSAAKGDTISIAAALQPNLAERLTPAGIVLNFGGSQSITLSGLSAFDPSTINWLG